MSNLATASPCARVSAGTEGARGASLPPAADSPMKLPVNLANLPASPATIAKSVLAALLATAPLQLAVHPAFAGPPPAILIRQQLATMEVEQTRTLPVADATDAEVDATTSVALVGAAPTGVAAEMVKSVEDLTTEVWAETEVDTAAKVPEAVVVGVAVVAKQSEAAPEQLTVETATATDEMTLLVADEESTAKAAEVAAAKAAAEEKAAAKAAAEEKAAAVAAAEEKAAAKAAAEEKAAAAAAAEEKAAAKAAAEEKAAAAAAAEEKAAAAAEEKAEADAAAKAKEAKEAKEAKDRAAAEAAAAETKAGEAKAVANAKAAEAAEAVPDLERANPHRALCDPRAHQPWAPCDPCLAGEDGRDGERCPFVLPPFLPSLLTYLLAGLRQEKTVEKAKVVEKKAEAEASVKVAAEEKAAAEAVAAEDTLAAAVAAEEAAMEEAAVAAAAEKAAAARAEEAAAQEGAAKATEERALAEKKVAEQAAAEARAAEKVAIAEAFGRARIRTSDP